MISLLHRRCAKDRSLCLWWLWSRHFAGDSRCNLIPTGSMYGRFIYIWLIVMVNVVVKYTIHGWYGYVFVGNSFGTNFCDIIFCARCLVPITLQDGTLHLQSAILCSTEYSKSSTNSPHHTTTWHHITCPCKQPHKIPSRCLSLHQITSQDSKTVHHITSHHITSHHNTTPHHHHHHHQKQLKAGAHKKFWFGQRAILAVTKWRW